jgi:hypothetical protein
MGGHPHHRRRRRIRRSSSSAPAFVRYAVLVLAAVLIVTLAWRGIRWTARSSGFRQASSNQFSPELRPVSVQADLWQRDFAETLASAAREVRDGNISSAEMAVDRADNVITAARLESREAKPDFFTASLAELDGVLEKHPDDQRLLEHVTLARISLAELRSSQSAEPAAALPGDKSLKRVPIGAPRPVAANVLLDPASLGGRILDATLMPDTSEILLPPFSRVFADGVRVEHLTIEGAAQTLDGIRWRNVTFVGTRLRYEGGPLDLQNVQFIRCSFGLTTDDRGARLATAIALGKTSFAID